MFLKVLYFYTMILDWLFQNTVFFSVNTANSKQGLAARSAAFLGGFSARSAGFENFDAAIDRFWKKNYSRRRHWGVKRRLLKNWKCRLLKRVAPAFEKWKLLVLRNAAPTLQKFKPRFWGVKRRLWKYWNRRRRYSSAKRRFWKIWCRHRRFLKNKFQTAVGGIQAWSAGFSKIESAAFWNAWRRLWKNGNFRFWGTQHRLWKNSNPVFESWSTGFENIETTVGRIQTLSTDFWKNTDRRRCHWGEKCRLGFFEKMDTPGFDILNAGFGKIETPFSRLHRLLKS